jgi:E3 ubiquitin-protein ligase TRIP12
VAKLQECVITAHGYNEKSRPVRDFIKYLTELEPKMRPMFLRFVTGSPRLPIGGFASLEPHLTVVLKKPLNPGESPDLFCPSVMTCQNYIKMPEYSSYEVLKNKFDYAIQNGVGHFSLS